MKTYYLCDRCGKRWWAPAGVSIAEHVTRWCPRCNRQTAQTRDADQTPKSSDTKTWKVDPDSVIGPRSGEGGGQ